jgi:hypothetical protein
MQALSQLSYGPKTAVILAYMTDIGKQIFHSQRTGGLHLRTDDCFFSYYKVKWSSGLFLMAHIGSV